MISESVRLERQSSLRLSPGRVRAAVIGAGGTGSWVAYLLGLAGVASLKVFDGDVVSLNNLNRLPLKPSDVGRKKSEAMCSAVNELREAPVAVPYSAFSAELHLEVLKDCNWVVACTDTLASRRACAVAAKQVKAKYVEVSAEGERAQVFFSPADFETPLEQHPGYVSVPVFVGPCVVGAAIACEHILRNDALCQDAEKDLVYEAGWCGGRSEFEIKISKATQKGRK